jgi:hypothetical protein
MPNPDVDRASRPKKKAAKKKKKKKKIAKKS